MAQIGAVFVFCSSCKILYFASSVHPKNATEKCYTTCSQFVFKYTPLKSSLGAKITRTLVRIMMHGKLGPRQQNNAGSILIMPCYFQFAYLLSFYYFGAFMTSVVVVGAEREQKETSFDVLTCSLSHFSPIFPP